MDGGPPTDNVLHWSMRLFSFFVIMAELQPPRPNQQYGVKEETGKLSPHQKLQSHKTSRNECGVFAKYHGEFDRTEATQVAATAARHRPTEMKLAEDRE